MLFGHQNDDTKQPTPGVPAPQSTPLAPPPPPAPGPVPGLNPLAVDSDTGASLPVAPPQPPALDEAEPSILDQPVPGAPESNVVIEPVSPFAPSPEPTAQVVAPTAEPVSLDVPEPGDTPSAPVKSDLLSLKQQALSQLSPLVGQLEQTPEEKFRTTMMLIQSTDNQSLLQEAYDAAQAITDEKARAQALLDVVNEINYFTQPKPEA